MGSDFSHANVTSLQVGSFDATGSTWTGVNFGGVTFAPFSNQYPRFTFDGADLSGTDWHAPGRPPTGSTFVGATWTGATCFDGSAAGVHAKGACDQGPDVTPPTVVGAPTSAPSPYGWFNAAVTVHWTCTDDALVARCPGDTVIGSDGAGQQITSDVALDAAGNSATGTVTGINIDYTPPTGYWTPDVPSNPDGTYTLPVTFTATCIEPPLAAASGIATCPDPLVFTQPGWHQVRGTAVDKAGNQGPFAEPSVHVVAPPDHTPPAIRGMPDRTPDRNGWYRHGVVVTWTCADDVAVQTCPPPTVVTGDGKGLTATSSAPATDTSGNASALGTLTGIDLDSTPPTAKAVLSATRVLARSPVPVTCQASDDLSGVESCVVVSDGTNVTGLRHAHVVSTDRAGNTATSAPVAYTVLADRPSLSWSAPTATSLVAGRTYTFRVAVRDALGRPTSRFAVRWVRPAPAGSVRLKVAGPAVRVRAGLYLVRVTLPAALAGRTWRFGFIAEGRPVVRSFPVR
jgi:hypothetical protein